MQPDQIAVDIRWLNQQFLLWVKAEAGRDPYDIHLRTGMPLPAISRLINMPITEVANRASETVLQFRVRFPDSWWNDVMHPTCKNRRLERLQNQAILLSAGDNTGER